MLVEQCAKHNKIRNPGTTEEKAISTHFEVLTGKGEPGIRLRSSMAILGLRLSFYLLQLFLVDSIAAKGIAWAAHGW